MKKKEKKLRISKESTENDFLFNEKEPPAEKKRCSEQQTIPLLKKSPLSLELIAVASKCAFVVVAHEIKKKKKERKKYHKFQKWK